MTIGLMPNGGTPCRNRGGGVLYRFCYYNNGNSQSEPTTVPASPYTRKNMSFCGWSIDSLSTPSYKPGEKACFLPSHALCHVGDHGYDFPYTGIMYSLLSPRTASMSLKCGAVPGAAQKWTPLWRKAVLAAIPKVIRR